MEGKIMKDRQSKRTPIKEIVQEKVDHSGFHEQNAPVKSKTVRKKMEPLDHIDHSGVHGEPYRKK